MKKHTASEFSKKFITLASSWSYCKSSFAGKFDDLSRSGAFQESGPGEKIWETRSKYVLKVPVENDFHAVYKGYRRISRPLSYLLRPSPCGLESLNYQLIADLGIPVPELLAAGEERSFFRLQGAYIVTRFAEGFQDGRAFLPGAPPMEDGEELKEEFLRRHLTLLARCHDAGILHRGFTPANIMWKKRAEADPEGNRLDLLWIDLASCRRLPLLRVNASCRRDLAACLKPFRLPCDQLSSLVGIYCSARKKVPPCAQRLEAELQK